MCYRKLPSDFLLPSIGTVGLPDMGNLELDLADQVAGKLAAVDAAASAVAFAAAVE